MIDKNHKLFVLFLVLLLGFAALGVSAQGESAGTLVLGQPVVSQITEPGQTVTFEYDVSEPSQISLQALAEGVPPTITILQDGALVASDPNSENAVTITLNVFLNAGTYQVEVGARNDATGLIVMVLQSEQPAPPSVLTPGSTISGVVSQDFPFALYSFDALTEPAYLYIESGLPEGGVNARLVWAADVTIVGEMDASVLGARFRIPGSAGESTLYQVEIEVGDVAGDAPFTLCLAAVSTGGCETGSVPPPVATEQVTVIEPPLDPYCRATSATGSDVNIRQSASTAAIIVASLPANASADVIGISPDGAFYNVLYSGSNGWVALNVVNSSGNCTDILTITPPSVILPQNPQGVPTQPPPQQQPAPPTAAPPAASGPCLITMSGDMLIYTQPNALPDNIYDQVHAGYELIPTGRLADNSWWKTNYADAWVQLALLNGVGQITGDCNNLAVISG